MRQFFAISAIGRDRPGIVADVAGLIYETGCNMEDSSMTILGNQFALLTLLSGSGEGLEHKLSTGCKRLEKEKRLTVFFAPVETSEIGRSQQMRGEHYTLTAEGLDKVGIVFKVSRLLAEFSINIASMTTHSLPSPESGTPIYTMAIEMVIPETCPTGELRTKLDRVSEELAIEIQLEKKGE